MHRLPTLLRSACSCGWCVLSSLRWATVQIKGEGNDSFTLVFHEGGCSRVPMRINLIGVKFAREEANNTEVAEQKIGEKVFQFLFR